MRFESHTLVSILEHLRKWREQARPGDLFSFTAPNPDLLGNDYSGKNATFAEGPVKIRSLRTWIDLAELCHTRMLMPSANGDWANFHFMALDPRKGPHYDTQQGQEKYGASSAFAHIDKREDPWFVATFMDALQDVRLKPEDHVMDLGCNRGDAFALIEKILGAEPFSKLELTGIDYAPSALEQARTRFPDAHFMEADIRNYASWELNRCDLLLCLGTLQSPELRGKEIFHDLFKKLVAPTGAIVLGFPNVRYMDGELSYGARMKNYTQPEKSLLIKDLFHYRRYLQKRGYRVRLHGKYDIFLIADKPSGTE